MKIAGHPLCELVRDIAAILALVQNILSRYLGGRPGGKEGRGQRRDTLKRYTVLCGQRLLVNPCSMPKLQSSGREGRSFRLPRLREKAQGDEGADLHEDLGGLRVVFGTDYVFGAVQDAPEDVEEPLELEAAMFQGRVKGVASQVSRDPKPTTTTKKNSWIRAYRHLPGAARAAALAASARLSACMAPKEERRLFLPLEMLKTLRSGEGWLRLAI